MQSGMACPVDGSHLWNSVPCDVTSDPTPAVFWKRLIFVLLSGSFPS